MEKLRNVMTCKCGQPSDRTHHISVVRGRHYFLCDRCHQELMKPVGDQVMLVGMMRSYLTPDELKKISNEQQEAMIAKHLQDKVADMFVRSGYPQRLALPGVNA